MERTAETIVLLAGQIGPGNDHVADVLADDERPMSVRTLPQLADLFDVLTKSIVHCLVLPSTVEGTNATRIVQGVRGLYPDLPIVVAGILDDPIPEELDVSVVAGDGGTDVDADTIATAIRSTLESNADTNAARPPSRMETLLLSMLDNLPVHLYAKDDEARHLITSSTNQSPTDLIGLTDLEYSELPEYHRKAAYKDDMSVIEGDGKRVEVEEYADHDFSHTLTSKVPWYDEHDDVIGLVGLTRDITEHKEREQASRRQHELLAKVALVAAHELRNELQVASGRLELVNDNDRPRLEEVAKSQQRLSNIIDKVVGLASAERTDNQCESVWLSRLSREVWNTFDSGTATLTVVEDVRFDADSESMSLFLQALFKNAVEHGGCDVTVAVGAVEGGLYVADDGTGIDVQPRDRVFDAGYTTEPDGTGFGLYVARSIVDDHGWRISLTESDDGGARFEVVGPTLDDQQAYEDDENHD